MKINSLFLTLFLTLTLYVTGWAQTVTVSGPDSVEVGISAVYKAVFNGGSTHPTSYKFEVPWLGANATGESGLMGTITGGGIYNFKDSTTQKDTLALAITWGDFFNETRSDNVDVTVYYGTSDYKPGSKSVKVKRVWAPIIVGPSSIQKCCTSPVTYTATEAGDANVFEWTVSTGGTIIAGAGTKIITVLPSTTDGFTVSCTASRTTGLPTYTRKGTKSVTRSQPITSAIDAASYFCIGTEYKICVKEICGTSAVTWNLPPTLQLLSGAGTACISVTPVSTTVGGTTGKITAQITLTGGCTATVSPDHNFTIYGAETPPTPQGYITIELDGGTPCNDPTYKVVWHPSNPYLNGYTSVSPKVILGGVHPSSPHGGHEPVTQIKITVCYFNFCSGKKNCIEFLVDPPQPCLGEGLFVHQDEQGTTPAPDTIGERRAVDDVPAHQDILIYPNPSTGFFSVKHATTGELSVYESTGRLIDRTTLQPGNTAVQFPTAHPLQRGVYLVQIKTNTATITQKLIVQ